MRPPTDLYKTYLGAQLAARIELDGSIVWQGRRLDSLSTAGALARQSVRGPRPDGKAPQTNGWTFWLLRDDTGEEVSVDDLRRQLYQRRQS